MLFVTPSAVLAVDRFVGASGNSHVKKDVGVLGLSIVHVPTVSPSCDVLVYGTTYFLQLRRICIKAIFFLSLSDIFGRCRGMWMLPNRNVCEISQPCAIES